MRNLGTAVVGTAFFAAGYGLLRLGQWLMEFEGSLAGIAGNLAFACKCLSWVLFALSALVIVWTVLRPIMWLASV